MTSPVAARPSIGIDWEPPQRLVVICDYCAQKAERVFLIRSKVRLLACERRPRSSAASGTVPAEAT